MRRPAVPSVPTGALAGALLLVVAASLWWVGHAFDSVPLRWDPSIGNSCKGLLPETEDELRRAAVVPLVLVMLSLLATSALAVRDAADERPVALRWAVVAMGVSGLGGGWMTWAGYAVGDAFGVLAVLVIATVLLALALAVLVAGRATRATNGIALRLAGVAFLQLVVVPGIVMHLTPTGEISIC